MDSGSLSVYNNGMRNDLLKLYLHTLLLYLVPITIRIRRQDQLMRLLNKVKARLRSLIAEDNETILIG
jgi:hypothetical protein